MLSPQSHTIPHTSKFLSYLHPYVFTYDIDDLSVHFWTCTKGSPPAYNGTLQGQILEPLETRLISSNRLIIRSHSDKNNIDTNDLLIYQLPGANLLDSLSLGDVGSFELGAKGLLGVADDKIAIWRHAGFQDGDVIDLYVVSSDGKFGVPTTLKAGSSLFREYSIRGNGYLSDEPVYIDLDQVLAISTKSKVPRSLYLTRWSTQSDQATRKVYDFNDPPSEDGDWWTQLGSHLYIRSSDSLIVASHSSPVGFTNLNPSMTLVSIDTKTTDVNWKISLLQQTENLVYLPSYDAILAIGDTFSSPTSISIVVLDPHSGATRKEHILPAPEAESGRISTSRAGIAVDLALSQQVLIVIFGDGQSTLIQLDKFMKEGFGPFVNDKGRFRTVSSCPETPFGVPRNSKERKRVQKGGWRWIHRASIGDELAVLVPDDTEGFVVAPFVDIPVV